MAKFVLIISVSIIFELIFGTFARPDNYRISENRITRLRDVATKWKGEINSEKHPCEEFYNFVCSKKSYSRPNWKYPEDYLEDIFNTKSELFTEIEEKYFKYSKTCRHFKQDEKEEFSKLFKFEKSIGNWPAFEEKWNDNKFNLSLAIAEMYSYGYPVFFTHNLIFDYDFKSYLKVRQLGIVTIKNNTDLFEFLFAKLGVQNSDDVLNDATLFEKTFNEAVESIKLSPYRKIKFFELKEYLPEVDWNKQIEIVYGGKLPDDYPVFLDSEERLKKIFPAISKLSPKVIANYFFCVFIYNINDLSYVRIRHLFMPVEREIFMKYIYDEKMKEILKGMYIKFLEILQDQTVYYNFEIHHSSEEIAKFVNEDIFGIPSKINLSKEFNEVLLNSNDCVKDYHRLLPLFKKRSAEPVFSKHFSLLSVIKNQIINDLVDQIPKFITEPSPFIIEPIVTYALMDRRNDQLNEAFSTINATKECFSKQFTEELTNHHIKILFASQFILRVFAEWTKNYPNLVQEENKILQEYDLNSEKLLVISIGKYGCDADGVATAFANSMEFSRIYNCPHGSKMNAPKCSIWRN